MNAIRLHQRGGPEQIVFEDAPVPAPGVGEVLVRVRAAAITPHELTWDDTYQHADGRERLPSIPCHDVAGIVEALGHDVRGFDLGEAVYALVDFPRNGSAAEFVVVPAIDLARKPQSIDFVHAAAVPLSTLTAWQALFVHGGLTNGQRVLIHGAAGGVGGYAVQLARWYGAHVIGTASAQNGDVVRELGAHEVIDYTTSRFDEIVHDVDLVFDTVGGDTLNRSFKVVRRGGTLVSISAPPSEELARAAGIKGVFFIVRPSSQQLAQIAELVDSGKLKVKIQEVYPLQQARAAFERSLGGHVSGKIILKVN